MKTGLIYLLMLTSVITHAQQQPRLVLPFGHISDITSADFSPDGKYIVTASNDMTAIIWDVISGKELHRLKGHTTWVYSVSFSPDGKYVVTASWDYTVRIWEAATGKSLHMLKCNDWVYSVSFSPDGKYVVTASHDGSAIIWDVISGKKLHRLEGHTRLIHSALFSFDGKYVVTASLDSTARIWDVYGGKELFNLKGHIGFVYSASFSFDGKYVVTASNDSTAKIWDAISGKELNCLKGHTDEIFAVSYSNNGRYLLTFSRDKTARIWDASSGKELHRLQGHTDLIASAKFSSDGKYVVTASYDKIAKIWDASTGKELHHLQWHKNPIISASFSKNGKYVVTTSKMGTMIWDALSGKEYKRLQRGQTLGCNSASFSASSKYVITTSRNTAKIWDVYSGKELFNLKGHNGYVYSASFSLDGKYVVTASNDSTAKIWDATSGKELNCLNGHTDEIFAASFSKDGKYIVTASEDLTARIWDASSGKQLHILKGHTSEINSALFSNDGKYIVTASYDKTARIWDASSGKQLHDLKGHKDFVNFASFSTDGKYVVTASWDSSAKIWEVSSGKELHHLQGHTNWLRQATFSLDGKYVVTASLDNTARIWDISSGREIYRLEGHNDYVYTARFSNNGKYVVTASGNTAIVWDIYSGKKLHSFKGHTGEINSALFSNDEKTIITCGDDHKTILWDATTGKQLYTRLQLDNDDWLVYDEDYHFDGTPGAIEKLYFVCGLEVIDLGQLKDSLWIPGLAEKIMENQYSDNQRLLINDKDAPKLSNLNICDLTPVIEQIEPDKDSKKLRFRITPRNGGLGATEVYINNNLTYTYQPNQLEQQTENQKKVYYLNLHTDTLKGYLSGNRDTPNPLLVKSKVKGSGIYSRGVEVTISNDLDKEESPAFYGVFVGVNDYGNYDGTNKNKYSNLKMAAKDAEDLASAVEATARNLFDNTHIYRITGYNGHLPTKEVLQKTLDEIGKKAKASDVLYIFFAGHGDIKQLNGEEQIRFMLYRADKNNPETSSFGVHDLMEWCRPSNIKAQKRVFVFDACHSGKFSQEFAFGRGDDDGARIRQLDKLKDKNGMIILAASAENEEAYEDETLNQGVLTYNLLQVMQMQKNDSSLIVRGWFDETIKLVEEYSRANGKSQHPNSFGDGRFEIGNINEQVRKTIQITAPKIRIGECALVASDDLSEKEYPGLDEKLNAVFRNTTRGDGFVYSELKSKSYSIKGAYTSSKKQIKLRYKLYFGDQPVGNPLTLILDKSKSTDEDIVVEIEKSIRENIRKLK
jgi:WD40 repeat protein